MKKLYVSIIVISIVLFYSLSGVAQQIDLTGKWEVDKDKSEFGPLTQANPDMILTIEQNDNTIKINSFMRIELINRETSTDNEYLIYGKEHIFKNEDGKELKYTCRYENDKIILDSEQMLKRIINNVESTIPGNSHSVYELSDDGKVLTVVTVLKTRIRVSTMNLVYNNVK